MNIIDKLKLDLNLESKKAMVGYIFVSPLIIGFILFFLYPFIQSILFSVSTLNITADGFELDFVGLKNYQYSLFVDPDFRVVFTETTIQTITNLPAVIIFSFFAANLINQKFRGRMLVRGIFFLPVIISSGVILLLSLEGGLYGGADLMAQRFSEVEGSASSLGGPQVEEFLLNMNLPTSFVQYIITMVNRVPEIIESSAIPILIFLAGLQSIPASLYEAADIDGATAWESFWKITFPLLSPLFLTNIVYIIIDSFTSARNPLVSFIQEAAWGGGGGYGVSVAMAWIYFSMVGLILVITYLIISRNIVYMD